MPKKLVPDNWLFGVVLALLGIGVVMVYSASAIVAAERFKDPYFFLKKQLFWGVVGSMVMLGVMTVDYRKWRPWIVPLLAISFILLVLVLIPPFGREINGTRRWLRLGPLSFQPTELAKIALVFYLAEFLDRRRKVLGTFVFGFLPPLVVVGALALLVVAQPDLGNSLAMVAMVFCMLYIAGASLKQMALVGALGVLPLAALAVMGTAYRLKRIFVFLDPWADPRGAGFQIIQSFLALAGGGLWGKGLGESKQKLFYLPEPHTDFIFAIIGEELGFIGATALMLFFGFLIWRGIRVGLRAPDAFASLLAIGLTSMLATQAIINLGVVVGLLPTKGLPLPLVSFGGSSLVMTMLSVGVLLNISQHSTWGPAMEKRSTLSGAGTRARVEFTATGAG